MDPIDRRQHSRHAVVMVVMIAPNGHEHRTTVYDLSEGGARVGLPDDWEAHAGAGLKLYFVLDDGETIMLRAQVARVAVDHMGLQFAQAQGDTIRQLLGAVGSGEA